MNTNHKHFKKILVLTLLFLGVSTASNAQFLKKLKKKVENAVENKVINKTSDKAAQKTGEQMEKIFNLGGKKSTVDPTSLPDSYDFEWKYVIKMTTQENDFLMNYYLKSGAKYYGAIPDTTQASPGGNMLMVMDIEKNINTIFMDMNGSKTAFIMDVNFDDIKDETDNDIEDFTITEMDRKNILGYTCQGFKMENKEVEMIMYFTNEAPVSFTQIYGFDQKRVPKGFNPKWLKYGENALMMEMEFKNKKKKKHSSKMVCTELVEAPMSLSVGSYQFMGN